MKKLILSLIAVAVGTLGSFAQDDLVATLSHGSNLSTFTGLNALSEAYTAAADGDIITLSAGDFNAVNVEKAITIRGASMGAYEAYGYYEPTRIIGGFMVKMTNSSTSIPFLESLRCKEDVVFCGDIDAINQMKQVSIQKCFFEKSVSCWNCNPKFINCIICSTLWTTVRSENWNWGGIDSWKIASSFTYCIGCVIANAYTEPNNITYPNYSAKFKMSNCVVWLDCSGSSNANSSYNNCIILEPTYTIPESCSIRNCVIYGEESKLVNVPTSINTIVDGYSSLFKTLTSKSFKSQETFELTDAAAAKYLGDDGTQVGIYGGTNPFNPSPTNPKVKKFTVNSNASNGKLNVKINVE